MTAPRVVVVGDVCTDVVALLAGEPAPGSDRPAAIATRGGGAGANVAAHLAALGTPVTLAGCVGDDLPGQALCRDLAAAGVTLAVRTLPGVPTGTIISLVEPGGERSMLADRGANLALRAGDVPVPAAGGHLHLSGYTLLDPGTRAAGLAALDAAVAAGCTDPTEAARALTGRHPVVVVSLGADGALWAAGDVLVHRPAHPVQVVDTTGAGDAFAAGLLSVWLADPGGDPVRALEAGLARAAVVVSRPGAR